MTFKKVDSYHISGLLTISLNEKPRIAIFWLFGKILEMLQAVKIAKNSEKSTKHTYMNIKTSIMIVEV